MANTYTQFYVHLIFAVKNRDALIHKKWQERVEQYITGIVQQYGHKLIAIGSMPGHIHILIGYNLNQLIPELVERIKTGSNKWINSNHMLNSRFEWQKGYGGFTYSKSQIDKVVKYILNQEQYHKKRSFREEYLDILIKNQIEFFDNYLFDFFENINSS